MAKHRMRICIGYNDDGSPVEKMISGSTQHELADRVVLAMLNSERRTEFLKQCGIIDGGGRIASPVPTFGKYAERWLQVYKVGKLRPKTLKGYQDKLKNQLLPAFGDVLITDITAESVQTMLDERKHYSHKTLQEVLTLLRSILRAAVCDKLIDSNPATDTRIYNPSITKNERKALPPDEWRNIIDDLDKLNGFDKLYMALVVFTGMRRSEILGLRWEDIDIANNVINVKRGVTHISNQPIIGLPKTAKGERNIPIMQELLKYLAPVKDSGFVIVRDKAPDEPITLSTFNHMWKRIKGVIDLHDVTSHGFRHTIGTLLNDVGADPKTIQGVMGHADISTTMNTYVHCREDRKQAAMAHLNDQISA